MLDRVKWVAGSALGYVVRGLDRGLCRIGCHYWSRPGGKCLSCGVRDR